ncbi:MAG: DbpA RNA binding domain-containing protein [Gemmatimonadota bacterium]
MTSFDDLDLRPEVVEALASEGIESPTPLQEAALPVLRRGHNLVLAAGPGSGAATAWMAALPELVEGAGAGTRCLVLAPTDEEAHFLAESAARIAGAAGHTVAGVGGAWALPQLAHILVGEPTRLKAAAEASEIDLSNVQVLVTAGANIMETLGSLAVVEELLSLVPKDSQRIITALPLTDEVRRFAERHARRAAVLPPTPAEGLPGGDSPGRGLLRFRVISRREDEALVATVAELLENDHRHVLVYCRNEDRAADMGDHLTLHGFTAGAPGDDTLPVWLGVDALEARAAAEGAEGVTVLSADVPADADEMDRRHGLVHGGVVLVSPREIPHLRDAARRAGYALEPSPLPSVGASSDMQAFLASLCRAMDTRDVDAYLSVLQPLFGRYGAERVAAAAAALLRSRTAAPEAGTSAAEVPEKDAIRGWIRLFLSVGERDGVSPRDLLGAITGEAGVPGSAVGKIDIHESHTLVEIQDNMAQKVMKALNGTTIRGRAVRADLDRPKKAGSGAPRRRRP